MIADILSALVRANLAGALAALAVLALRPLVRRWFGARAAYGLWAVVPAAALATLVPQSQAVVLAPVVLTPGGSAASAVLAARTSLAPTVLTLWLGGALIGAGVLTILQTRYLRSRNLGPAVVGVLKPRIVTPHDFETRFGVEERRLILAHEKVHLARGDSQINAVAALAQCLCWFNPLVHFAVHQMRIDQELACDATVIDRFPAKRALYARLLLKTQLASQALPLGCHWPARSEHPLKERIAMLKSPEPRAAMRKAGFAAVVLLSTTGAGLAWAAQPAKPHAVITRPDWSERPAAEDARLVYPAAALSRKIEGSAMIGCRVDRHGELQKCAVISETPAGYGFGNAALSLAPKFRMRPATRDGKAVAGGVVRIPMQFRLPA